MKQYHVWHAMEMFEAPGEESPAGYRLVAVVHARDLEHAFAVTTSVEGPWWDNPDVRCLARTRPTSVGDVVVDPEGRAFRVEATGFAELLGRKDAPRNLGPDGATETSDPNRPGTTDAENGEASARGASIPEPVVIFAYTRAQAIGDGVLIDVTETAKEAGFRYPVALTEAVWRRYVKVPDGIDGQDEAGRLWDIVWMLRHGIRQQRTDAVEVAFQLYVRNDNSAPRLVTLKSVCGPDDDGKPCITVMLPDED